MKTRALGIVGMLLVATACVACGGDDEGGAPGAPVGGGPEGSGGETTPAPTSFELESKGDAVVRRTNGGNVEVRVKGGAAVAFEIDGLPAGIAAQPTSIAAGATDATIHLSFAAAVPAFGEHTIKVRGKSSSETREISLKLFVADDAGAIDATFGNKGVFSGSAGVGSATMAVDREGRTLVAGTDQAGLTWLKRYTTAGAPDTSFDGDGTMSFELDEVLGTQVLTIEPRADGAIFVGGARVAPDGKKRLCVAKLDDTGKADPAFGVAGVACPQHPGLGELTVTTTILHREDGSILAAGFTGPVALPKDALVLAIDPTGQVDKTFAVAGLSKWKAELTSELPMKIRADAEGRILVAGVSSDEAAMKNNPFVLRLSTSGQPDPFYGKGGMSIIDRDGMIMGMVLGPAGEAYLAGMEFKAGFTGTIHALDAQSGAPIPSFGTNGVVTLANAGFQTIAWDDGKLLVGGGAVVGQTSEAIAVRVSRTDGAVDPTYADNGRLTFPMAGGVQSIAIAPSSRAIMLLQNPNETFVVARTWR